MLPKLLEVPINTYLMVLAKMRLPSATPVGEHTQVLFEQHHIGGVLGDVGGGVHRDPDVGGVQGQRIVDAVAEEGQPIARCVAPRRSAALSARGRSGRRWCGSAPSRSNPASSRVSISAPVIVPLDTKPRSVQTFSATIGLSPVATLTSIPNAASCARESRAAALGSSAKTRKPSSVRSVSSSPRDGGQTPAPAWRQPPPRGARRRTVRPECPARRCRTDGAVGHHLLGCALDQRDRRHRGRRTAPTLPGGRDRTASVAIRWTPSVTSGAAGEHPTVRRPARWR